MKAALSSSYALGTSCVLRLMETCRKPDKINRAKY
jgi:hypothetical protein